MIWRKFVPALVCVGAGVGLFFAAEFADQSGASVENGHLLRNPCGKGEAVYEFYVDGLESDSEVAVTVLVPEQRMTEEEFSEQIPRITEVLCESILGENESLKDVRSDLKFVDEVPEYGVTVSWESEIPEIISTMGIVDYTGGGELPKGVDGRQVYLEATLVCGDAAEVVEIPVTVYPPIVSMEERFREMMEKLVAENPESMEILLPEEFEGKQVSYRMSGGTENLILVFLGVIAGVCMLFKEKNDLDEERKRRERSLLEDYPDLVSEFLILTGAGYSAKAAWKKLSSDYRKSGNKGYHPLYEEMEMAVNQMETGIPETRVYAEFGRRCQLRCYVKFASLLESSVSTGGKHLRNLLESEVEEAFKQRVDLAKRKGEELSSKLLLPMFGMLAVVMVMVVAPAFLSFL